MSGEYNREKETMYTLQTRNELYKVYYKLVYYKRKQNVLPMIQYES